MRYWIYGHVAAVICCALFSIADRHGMLVEPMSAWVYIPLGMLIWPSLLAMFFCPLAALISLLAWSRPWSQVLTGVVSEILLTFGHFMALLPAIH